MVVNLCCPKKDWFAPLGDVDVGKVVGLQASLQWVSDSSEFSCIISACRQLLKNSFHNSYIEFNRRQVNGVAHELVQAAPLNPSSHIIDDTPSCILSHFS